MQYVYTSLLSQIVFEIVNYDYVSSFLDLQNAEGPLLKSEEFLC